MQAVTNGTVLGVLPLRRILPLAGAVLLVLFVMIRPEASQGLNVWQRSLYWLLHIGVGLGGVWFASYLISRRLALKLPVMAAIVLSGLLGSVLVTPWYSGIEGLFPVLGTEVPDSRLDEFAAAGIWRALLVEWLEIMPPFVACWLAINLPLLLGKPQLQGPSPPSDPGPGGYPKVGGGGVRLCRDARPAAPETAAEETAVAARQAVLAQFYRSLPDVLGRNIIAISSDLHYLHVYTTQGRALVLGNLRDIAAALDAEGMLVHRSHWVAHKHLQRVAIAGSEASCVMSNGLRIPISRRKRKLVKTRYGQCAVAVQ